VETAIEEGKEKAMNYINESAPQELNIGKNKTGVTSRSIGAELIMVNRLLPTSNPYGIYNKINAGESRKK